MPDTHLQGRDARRRVLIAVQAMAAVAGIVGICVIDEARPAAAENECSHALAISRRWRKVSLLP